MFLVYFHFLCLWNFAISQIWFIRFLLLICHHLVLFIYTYSINCMIPLNSNWMITPRTIKWRLHTICKRSIHIFQWCFWMNVTVAKGKWRIIQCFFSMWVWWSNFFIIFSIITFTILICMSQSVIPARNDMHHLIKCMDSNIWYL